MPTEMCIRDRLGRSGTMVDEMSFARGAHPKVEIEQVNDWEGSQYRYCNEFLVDLSLIHILASPKPPASTTPCSLSTGRRSGVRCTEA